MGRLAIPVLLVCLSGCKTAITSPFHFHFHFREDQEEGVLYIYEGETQVLGYRYGNQLPAGVPEDRRRSSYIHPIWGLDGEVLTADFPKDHHHHRGLSLMWPRMQVGGRKCELWHIKGIRSHFQKWLERGTGEDRAVLEVENHWRMDSGRKVATETLRLVVQQATNVGRAIDVSYRLQAMEPVVVQGQVGKGYGGLNLRFGDRKRKETVLTTDKGPQPKDSDHGKFEWADLSAPFEGRKERSGIAVFVHQSHPDFPPPWTLRHYGDLNVAWPGLETVTLTPGEVVSLEYRLWIHRGNATDGKVEQAFLDYRSR